MDIGIVGGGSSGMILASILNKHHVTILEKNNKLGKKLLLTGNGKCNFTNLNFDNLEYIYNSAFAINLYKKYNNLSFIKYFESLGIVAKIETHKCIDYVYPNNNKATSVYYSLLDKIIKNNTDIVYNAKVISIYYINNKFEVNIDGNIKYIFDKLVLAFGGASYKKTGSSGECFSIVKGLGHKINDILPGLTPLRYCIDNINVNKINFTGFRVDARVSIVDNDKILFTEFGEIQFTKELISGIPILNISSKIARMMNCNIKDIEISLDFSNALINSMSNYESEYIGDFNSQIFGKNSYISCYKDDKKLINDVKNVLYKRMNTIPYKRVKDFLCGYLPDELNIIICEMLKLRNKMVKDLTSDELYSISKIITNFKVKVIKPNNFDNAQITVGGLDTSYFDSETLESKIVKGLYVIGEALDIDGICGGYNLQMCYSTASTVANSILNLEE